ncbi:MAG: hypothetical protein ACJ8ER_02480 [Allosphingosinicella sp.]
MTKRSGGVTIDQGDACEPRREAREFGAEAEEKGGKPSPDHGGSSPPDTAPIDLDTAHDRAS